MLYNVSAKINTIELNREYIVEKNKKKKNVF